METKLTQSNPKLLNSTPPGIPLFPGIRNEAHLPQTEIPPELKWLNARECKNKKEREK